MKRNFIACFILLLTLLGLTGHAQANSEHKIVVLVRDSAITEFQIRQRTNLMLMSSKDISSRLRAKLKSKSTRERWMKYVKSKRPTSKEEVMRLQKRFVSGLRREALAGASSGLRKKALNELINERLMVVTAKDNNIVISESEVVARVQAIAKRNAKGKMSVKAAEKSFYSYLRQRGVGRRTFHAKLRATIAWQKLIRKKFGHDVRFSDRDVEQQLGIDGTSETNKKIQFNLKKIVLDVGKTNDEKVIVDNMIKANAIRERFNGCANMRSLIAPYKNASVQNMGKKTLGQLPSPLNLIMSNMKVGQITPPQSSLKGLEMYAVCERKQVMLDDTQKNKVIAKLRQQAFELRSKRYLKDIRQEAHIEYRN